MKPTRFFDLKILYAIGVRRRLTGWLAYLIAPLAVGLALYVLAAATVLIIAPWLLVAVFLSGMMTIAFLTAGATPASDPDRPSLPDYCLSAASFITGIYFFWNHAEIVDRIALLSPLSNWDLFFGVLIVLLTLELTRRTTGAGLTIVVLLFIAYNLYGHLIGGVLGHGYIDYVHFIDIMVYTTDGIMGLPARVAATYAFLFVLFGTMLYAAKGGEFFFNFAAAISGGRPGGPAKVSVISSGLYGMLSGSPTSDVVTTGSVTIPVMKRLGYKPAVAGGIEVAASTGGSIVPPVMGAAAFIMAEYTGIQYREIAIAAILPALLYYTCVYSQVHFRALRFGLPGLDTANIPDLWLTLRKGGIFFIPLVVLTVALFYGYTPTMVAVFGAITVIFVSQLRRETRIGPIELVQALAETTYRMVPVAGATAAAGLVIAGITMTGLAAKFAHVVYAIAGTNDFFVLMLAAAMTLILGLGMPTPAAYILAAVLIGPLIIQLGIDPLPGHMFLLYFAVMSALTPPVAVAAYAASAIAEDNPLTIAGHAVKLALAAFVVPFVFVYGPELLWQGPLWRSVLTFTTAAVALVLLAAAIERYSNWSEVWWTRLLLAVGALLMLTPKLWSELVGVALVLAALAGARLRARAAVKAS